MLGKKFYARSVHMKPALDAKFGMLPLETYTHIVLVMITTQK